MERFNHYPKTALFLILPQVVVTILFFIWPACNAVWQSLFYADAFGLHKHFAGLENFKDILLNPDYGHAVWVTIFLSVAITLLTMGFGLVLALLVNQAGRVKKVYKTMLLWPYAVAPAIAAILWKFLFHPTLGWVTQLFNKMGVEFNYLVHPKQALWVIIITAAWQQFSYNFLFYFGALRLIPANLIEAAILDGANASRRFFHIIWPILSPTTFFLLTMNLIYSFFDTFGIIHILTNGGPEYGTTNLIFKVYEDGFVNMDLGSSAAQSVILLLIVGLLTLLQFRFLEKKVHYG